MSSSSDDEIIGAEAEQEYEQEMTKQETPKKTPAKRVKLTNGQRLKLIDAYRQGKTDKFYNVIPDKKKPGDYRIVKRRKPLDIPVVDTNPNPDEIVMDSSLSETNIPNHAVQQDKIEKNNKIKQEFFTMQNTINNSLSKEIAAVMEKCNKIEAKMKKQKAQMKQQRATERCSGISDPRKQRPPVQEAEYEYEYEEEIPEQEEQYYQPQYYSRFNARNRIDLRNFS
jgi:hypothetical protein